MDRQWIAQLNAIEVDTQGTLRRFCGNEALYERFLTKFGQDQTFLQIQIALENQNWEEMMRAAHTLKGISGNLGMNRLFQACAEMVNLLREQGGREEERVAPCFVKLQGAYREVIDALALK